MERLFINNNFHYVEVVPVTNGISVAPEKLADNIATLYSAKSRLPDYIVVWVDREGRLMPSSDIRQLIIRALVAAGAPENRLRVGVADKMSENWILADQELIKKEFELDHYEYCGDGANGKHELKQLCIAANKTYKETKVGADLLKKMRLSRVALVSNSANDFAFTIDEQCWWLET